MARILSILFLALCLCAPLRAEDIPVELPSGVEVVSQRFAAPQGPLLLWLTGEYGSLPSERQAATDLAAQGVEVWITDWLAPYFLPQLPGSIAKVPDTDLGDWLAAVQKQQPGREIYLMASGHAADLALRAARDARERLALATRGTVLLFPLLYRDLEAGTSADYADVVAATREHLAILIPQFSAGYWWRERLQEHLEAAGSRVDLNVLLGVRDGFYRRPDATDTEKQAGGQLGKTLAELLRHLTERRQP